MKGLMEDKKVCKKCGGYCCKQYPGAIDPADLGKNKKEIQARLVEMLRGNYIFDYWEGSFKRRKHTSYFLRPKVDNEVGTYSRVHGSWGGPCAFLTPSGCELPYEDRPRNCRELIPNPNYPEGKCKKGYDKEDSLTDWYKYRKMIKELIGR